MDVALEPNYDDFSCKFVFGQKPLPQVPAPPAWHALLAQSSQHNPAVCVAICHRMPAHPLGTASGVCWRSGRRRRSHPGHVASCSCVPMPRLDSSAGQDGYWCDVCDRHTCTWDASCEPCMRGCCRCCFGEPCLHCCWLTLAGPTCDSHRIVSTRG